MIHNYVTVAFSVLKVTISDPVEYVAGVTDAAMTGSVFKIAIFTKRNTIQVMSDCPSIGL